MLHISNKTSPQALLSGRVSVSPSGVDTGTANSLAFTAFKPEVYSGIDVYIQLLSKNFA
jgi:hypothetical protein